MILGVDGYTFIYFHSVVYFTDPGLKSGSGVVELISTGEKKKKA